MGAEHAHQMSLMSLCSQETCMETTNEDSLFEYSSQTGTPAKKNMQILSDSLLDTDKIMKEKPRMARDETDEQRGILSMDEEKSF